MTRVCLRLATESAALAIRPHEPAGVGDPTGWCWWPHDGSKACPSSNPCTASSRRAAHRRRRTLEEALAALSARVARAAGPVHAAVKGHPCARMRIRNGIGGEGEYIEVYGRETLTKLDRIANKEWMVPRTCARTHNPALPFSRKRHSHKHGEQRDTHACACTLHGHEHTRTDTPLPL